MRFIPKQVEYLLSRKKDKAEPSPTRIKRKLLCDKPPPMTFEQYKEHADLAKGLGIRTSRLSQWLRWRHYYKTYYRRYPAYISGMDLHRGWNDFIDCPRADGSKGHPTPKRPEGEKSLRSRFKHGWAVFTGKADAVYWLSQ